MFRERCQAYVVSDSNLGRAENEKANSEKKECWNNSLEDSGFRDNSNSSAEISRVSFSHPGKVLHNPFQSSILDRLRYPVCSPTLFRSIDTIPEVEEETEISPFPTLDFDESDVWLYNESIDAESEEKAQEAISEFFEAESQHLFITPDKARSDKLVTLKAIDKTDDQFLEYTCDPSTILLEIDRSTTWTQTRLTFPQNMPEEVEAAIMAVNTDDRITRLAASETPDSQPMNDAQYVQMYKQRRPFAEVCCQTIVSFPEKLQESIEDLLSPFEIFCEGISTDIRMSMMKRQLFNENKSSRLFHSSSPVAVVHSSSPVVVVGGCSPLQSGSFISPQCFAVRSWHHGYPMGNVSPTDISPIARPPKSSRFLSKLNFMSHDVETESSMCSSKPLPLEDTDLPSSDE